VVDGSWQFGAPVAARRPDAGKQEIGARQHKHTVAAQFPGVGRRFRTTGACNQERQVFLYAAVTFCHGLSGFSCLPACLPV